MAFLEVARPDYRVHEYFDGFYKLVKFKNSDRTFASLNDHTEDNSYDSKLAASYSRARSVVLQLALCNQWQYFFTGTLDKAKYNRFELFPFISDFTQWVRDLRKKGIPIRYMIVPEKHENGAWHIHGLLAGIPDSELSAFVPGIHPQKLIDGGFLNWGRFAQKFGFCSLGKVRDNIGVSFYLTKYITKDVVERGNSGLRCHLYYASHGLARARPFGEVYGSYASLDAYLDHHSDFCSTGFVACSWDKWLDYIDLGPDFVDTAVVPVQPSGCPEWEQMLLYGFDRGEVRCSENIIGSFDASALS